MLVGLLANYLPPDSYHYGKDPESYYLDNSLVYSDLNDCDLVIAGGDLNSRTREDPDYLPCVDANTPARTNPDPDKNPHGDYFLQFLKDNRALICNGRVTPELNDFTFVSPRGRSVPDYIYCPADHIQYCVSMQVLKVSDAINQFSLPVPFSLPDHSILISEFELYSCLPRSNHVSEPALSNNCPPKKNIRKINETFMSSVETIQFVNQTIEKLELLVLNQSKMDDLYSDIKSLFLLEIDKLPNLPSTKVKSHKKTLRKSAPFWNKELNDLWKIRCNSESKYLSFRCDGNIYQDRHTKHLLRIDFKQKQKLFDKQFRMLKRQHDNAAFHKLADLADKAANDPNEMWKRLKALSDRKTSHVLLEVIRQDGSISKDKKVVLEKWYNDFSQCFRGMKDDPDLVFDDEFLDRISTLKTVFDNLSSEQQEAGSSFNSTSLNCSITFDEVSCAIQKAKLARLSCLYQMMP